MPPIDPSGAPFRALVRLPLALFLVFLPAACADPPSQPADLILTGGTVWTGNPEVRFAEAVAMADERILLVGSREEIDRLRGPETRVMTLGEDTFVLPGFIDNHTHFGRAGELLLGINLLDVSSEAALVDSVRAARDRLPEGAWIVGGDWGAYAEWGRGSTGRPGEEAEAGDAGRPGAPGETRTARAAEFRPVRSMIDSVTPGTPALLSRWDREVWLANGAALRRAGAGCGWEGVECRDGEPTGRLSPEAASRVRAVVPETSLRQRLEEARVALRRLRRSGVTTIHDITPPEQLPVYQELLERGELTVRVGARPTLDRWDELRSIGVRNGFGDDRLRIIGLKGFVDGIMGNSSARFYEPYLTSGERGIWRRMMREGPGMQQLLIGADSAGFWPHVHAIGDQAIDTLLTMWERTLDANGPRDEEHPARGVTDRRFRVIHTQVLRGPEVARRMAGLGAIAEVQPYHAIDDMRWMEERIGSERARWAYAFRTLHEAGVRLSFGSDWPGTNAAWYPTSPVLGIHAAVTRQTLEGTPEEGWFPEERVEVETALRAYTVNNAWAEGAEEEKGSLEAGKLADVTVLDRNLLEVPPSEIRETRVLLTVVAGEVVYDGR